MSFERLLEKLEEDARAQAAAILEKARLQAEAITDEGKLKSQAEQSAIVAVAAWEANAEARRLVSAARQRSRMEVLALKQELLDEVRDRALAAFAALPPGELADWLAGGLRAAARTGREEVLPATTDRPLVAGLLDRVNEELRARGLPGELTLSAQDARVQRGCVLREGGLETNLSLEAALQEAYDRLEEDLVETLFGEAE